MNAEREGGGGLAWVECRTKTTAWRASRVGSRVDISVMSVAGDPKSKDITVSRLSGRVERRSASREEVASPG